MPLIRLVQTFEECGAPLDSPPLEPRRALGMAKRGCYTATADARLVHSAAVLPLTG